MDVAEIVSELRQVALFSGLSEPVLEQLARTARVVDLGPGEPVCSRLDQAECCYVVVSGVVELLVTSERGRSKAVELVEPHQSFGEAVMFLERPFPVDAVSTTQSRLLRVPAQAVNQLVETNPGAARAMLASLSVRLHGLVRDVAMYTVQSATERVSDYLLRSSDADQVVRFEPSKRAIASRLGITPETLSRTLRELSDRGVIELAAHQAHIVDRAALED